MAQTTSFETFAITEQNYYGLSMSNYTSKIKFSVGSYQSSTMVLMNHAKKKSSIDTINTIGEASV